MKQRAKAFWISKRKEIVFLLRNGKRWKSEEFSLVYLENVIGRDRAAVIVSRANGNAVTRNRIKRIYRAIFYKNKSIVPPFFDVLFIPAGNCLRASESIQCNYEVWKKSAKQ